MGKNNYLAYIGTNSVRGSRGVYVVRIDADTWEAEVTGAAQAYNTGGVALDPCRNRLYAANEGMTFEGWADGGVYAFRTNQDGTLTKLTGQRGHGQRTCCVSVDRDGENVYACSFFEGTWSAFPVTEDGIAPARLTVEMTADAPLKALHCIAPIGKGYVGVISLTECALIVYRAADGERITSVPFPENSFPRYFETSGRFVYAMMQSAPGAVYVLEDCLEKEGRLRHVQTISILEENGGDGIATSTLRATPDGTLLLAANRPTGTITVFAIREDGGLERRNIIKLPGDAPRDFNISGDGRLAVTALQQSDRISIHEIDYENSSLITRGSMIAIPSPAAVAVSGRMEYVG